MTARRLFALAAQSVVRAERGADGQWAVERVLTGPDVRCLEVDPLTPDVVYAGTQGQGVFRSADGGRDWRPVGLPGVIVKSLAASPHQPGVLYAGTKSPPLIYRSADAGVHWEELRGFRRVRGRWWWRSPAEPPFTAYVLALAISPGDPQVVLAGVEWSWGRWCAALTGARPGAIIAKAPAVTVTSYSSTPATVRGLTRRTAEDRR
jgi:hypothetical protein